MLGLGLGLNRSRGGKRGFRPTDQPGVVLWLDGRYGLLDSVGDPVAEAGQVALWQNRANPGTYDVTQVTGSRQPLYSPSDRALYFDGVDDFMQGGAPVTGNDWCMLIRFILNDPYGGGRMMTLHKTGDDNDQAGVESAGLMVIWTDDPPLLYLAHDSFNFAGNLSCPPHVEHTLVINSSSDGLNYRLNGVDFVRSTLGDTLNPDTLFIGCGWYYGIFQNTAFDLHQLLFFETARTEGQILELETWAAAL